MRRAARHATFALATVVVACTALPAAAHADAELTVSPVIMELDAEAGEVLTETITASASGDESITVELVHADFGFGPDYSPVLISDEADETTSFSTRGWFSLPRPRYRIPAGEMRDLPLRIAVPRNTPGGTYLGAALLRVLPPDAPTSGGQVQAVAQSGPLLFIAVEGGEPPKPRIREHRVPRLQARGPIRPKVVVDNRGDEFFTLEGSIRLEGPGDDEVVDIRRQFVVPGEPRTLQASDGDEDAGPPVLGSRELAFGRYEVTTRLRIEPTGTTLVSRRTVWIVPTWMRVAGSMLLLVALGCIVLVARWFARRGPAEATAPASTVEADPLDEADDVLLLEAGDVVDHELDDEDDVADDDGFDDAPMDAWSQEDDRP